MNSVWKKFSRPKVAIVTDSTANLTFAEALEYDIYVVPLQVTTGDKQYVENWKFDSTPIREAFATGVPVLTSQPPVVRFVEQYQKLEAEGYKTIISVHLSEKLSGTCDGARKAAELVEVPVHVIDSKCAAAALGTVVKTIAHPQHRYRPVDELRDLVTSVAMNTSSIFTVKNLDTLRRGGRISQLQHTVGNLLAIQPILQLRGGGLELHSRERGQRRAQGALVKHTQDFMSKYQRMDVTIHYFSRHDQAYELSQKLVHSQANVQLVNIALRRLSVVVAAHTGPDIIGVVATSPIAEL